jgi:hypothetical protein
MPSSFFQCDEKDKRILRMLYKRTEIERRALVVLEQKDCAIDRSFFSLSAGQKRSGAYHSFAHGALQC